MNNKDHDDLPPVDAELVSLPAEEATVGEFQDHRGPPPPPLPKSAKIPSRIGEMLADRYRLEKLIAKGGMGRVYLATQLPLERKVAIKLLLSKGFDDEFRQRFFLEASTCARLVHRHIVTVHDYGEAHGGELFMAMEYLDGQPLSKVIAREVRLESDRACQIALQTCRALRTAHKSGIVHRDLKPGNLMLLTDDEQESADFVKVLDFGLVKAFDKGGPEPPVDLTRSGTWLGSPRYMAPEQIRCQDVDPRTDIYSLGVILFHMIAGRPPFVGANSVEILEQHLRDPVPGIRELVGQINYAPELEEIIRTCMAKSPADRYQSMDDLIRDLKAVYRISTGVSIHTESSLPVFHDLARDADSQGDVRSHTGSTSGSAVLPAAPVVGPAPDLGPTLSGVAATSGASGTPPAPAVSAAPVLTPSGVGGPQPQPVEEKTGSNKYLLVVLALFIVLMGGFAVTRWVNSKPPATKVAIVPAKVRLTIYSMPPGVEVVGRDDAVLGRTPHVETLAATLRGSTQRFTLRHPGYADTEIVAELNADRVTVKSVLRKLTPPKPERTSEPAALDAAKLDSVAVPATKPRRKAVPVRRVRASRRAPRVPRAIVKAEPEVAVAPKPLEVPAAVIAAPAEPTPPARAPSIDDSRPSLLVDEGEGTTVSDSIVPVVD